MIRMDYWVCLKGKDNPPKPVRSAGPKGIEPSSPDRQSGSHPTASDPKCVAFAPTTRRFGNAKLRQTKGRLEIKGRDSNPHLRRWNPAVYQLTYAPISGGGGHPNKRPISAESEGLEPPTDAVPLLAFEASS